LLDRGPDPAAGDRPDSRRGLVWAVLVAVLALNLYQAYPLARDRNAGLQKLETMVFHMMQRAQRKEPWTPRPFCS